MKPHIKYKYKLTTAQVEWLDGITECQICGRSSDLCVDHSHSTGGIRGKLCRMCNGAIGLLNEDISRLSQYYKQVLYISVPYRIGTAYQYRVKTATESTDILELYNNGYGITDICKRLSLTRHKVYTFLKSNTTLRKPGSPAPSESHEDKRVCRYCHKICDLSNLRTFGKSVSYSCKDCYYSCYWIQYKYGLPKEVYDLAVAIQGDICPILNIPMGPNKVVDHKEKDNHIYIRGVIHRKANLAIEQFPLELIPKVQKYLDS